jgi:hypothetical protein
MTAHQKSRWWKMILAAMAGLLLCGVAAVTFVDERKADNPLQSLGGESEMAGAGDE